MRIGLRDLGLLVLRLTVGGFMAGHGAQKLFGWFNGPGLKGTHGMMEHMGMKPGQVWGTVVALGEFNGGVLTALGFLNPLGPLNIAASMTVAAKRAHWSNGIWNQQGGVEFPVTNLAAALAIVFAGPGNLSMDGMFGIKMPRWFVAFCVLLTGGSAYLAMQHPEAVQQAIETVNRVAPTSMRRVQPDLEVETRPVEGTEAHQGAQEGEPMQEMPSQPAQ